MYADSEMLRAPLTLLLCFAVLPNGYAKDPDFQDYPTEATLDSPPAEPRLTTPWTRKYQTRIRRGVTGQEGFRRGSEYIEAAGPNFARHYRVVNWGCGTGCLMMVVVDLKTGAVYPPPMSTGPTGTGRIVIPRLGSGWGDFDFRTDSRLFIMRTCPWGSPDPKSPLYRGPDFCGTSYFVVESQGFRLLQRVPEQLVPVPE
jgi:hypothetical protein